MTVGGVRPPAPRGDRCPGAASPFETAFAANYIITDFVFDQQRGLYVLTHGESTLEQFE